MDSKMKVKLGVGVGILVIAGSVFALSSGGMFQGSSKSLNDDVVERCNLANVKCQRNDKRACTWYEANKVSCGKAWNQKLAELRAAEARANSAAAAANNAAAAAPQANPLPSTFAVLKLGANSRQIISQKVVGGVTTPAALGAQDSVAVYDGDTMIATTSQYAIDHANGLVPELLTPALRSTSIFNFNLNLGDGRLYTIKLLRGADVVRSRPYVEAAPAAQVNAASAATPGVLSAVGDITRAPVGQYNVIFSGQRDVSMGEFTFRATNEPIDIQVLAFQGKISNPLNVQTRPRDVVAQVYLYNGNQIVAGPELLNNDDKVIFTGNMNLVTVTPGTDTVLTLKANIRDRLPFGSEITFENYIDLANAQTEFQIYRSASRDLFNEANEPSLAQLANSYRAINLTGGNYTLSREPNTNRISARGNSLLIGDPNVVPTAPCDATCQMNMSSGTPPVPAGN